MFWPIWYGAPHIYILNPFNLYSDVSDMLMRTNSSDWMIDAFVMVYISNILIVYRAYSDWCVYHHLRWRCVGANIVGWPNKKSKGAISVQGVNNPTLVAVILTDWCLRGQPLLSDWLQVLYIYLWYLFIEHKRTHLYNEISAAFVNETFEVIGVTSSRL